MEWPECINYMDRFPGTFQEVLTEGKTSLERKESEMNRACPLEAKKGETLFEDWRAILSTGKWHGCDWAFHFLKEPI